MRHKITFLSKELYPFLYRVPRAPRELYAIGSERALRLLDHVPNRGLAVVGTRRPIPYSKTKLASWIRELRGANLIIISGFAVGIDAAAHESAIRAGLPTIAVLGTGLNQDYPPQNRDLRREILENDGLLISELREGPPQHASVFVNRNRLIAGWSMATLIAQAPNGSGALHTAQWALDQNRDIYAVPAFPDHQGFEGNQRLLESGAIPFWSAMSLTKTWSELFSHVALEQKRLRLIKSLEEPDSIDSRLLNWIGEQSSSRGGVLMEDIWSWADSVQKPPLECLEALQKLIKVGEVVNENGVLLKNLS